MKHKIIKCLIHNNSKRGYEFKGNLGQDGLLLRLLVTRFLMHIYLQAIEELSVEKLTELRDIFSFFDRDGGGSIGAEEFAQVMRTFGWDPTEEELKVNITMNK